MIDLPSFDSSDAGEVFVSFTIPAGDDSGGKAIESWVESFLDLFRKSIGRILGQNISGSIWTDLEAAGSGRLTPGLISRLQDVSVFVIVLSPEYLRSEMIADGNRAETELPTFLRLIDKDNRVDVPANVYIVEYTETPQERPSELAGAKVFRFWSRPEHNVETYRPTIEDHNFVELLNDLALEVAFDLRSLSRKSSQDSPAEAASDIESGQQPRVTVYLASVAGELDPHRRKVKRYLEQSGITVVPQNADAERFLEHPELIEQELNTADLFVQLLNCSPGPMLVDRSESLAGFQQRRASEMELPNFQWRSPDLEVEDIEEAVKDPNHRRLLLANTVQAVDLEDFNRNVIENAKPRISKETVPEMREGFIFINAETRERPVPQELLHYLEACDLEYFALEHTGSPEEIRRDLAQSLIDTDGMIVVYDSEDNRWLHAQLREIQRILARYRDKASSPKVVFEGPGHKPPVGMRLKNMFVVKCENRFDPEKLKPFLDQVEERARKRLEALDGPVLIDEQRDYYDVFLAHNNVDKDFVRAIYRKLRERGVYPWLDENEILPGQWFQDVIQESIRKVSSAAFFVGRHGLGRFQQAELRALLQKCIDRDIPLIPVLLPGVAKIPSDLLFLEQLNWVRFESEDDEAPLDSLMRGIRASQVERRQ